ncbi:hypothetical protein DSECCO2_581530 [anaerobic digester metagenome]
MFPFSSSVIFPFISPIMFPFSSSVIFPFMSPFSFPVILPVIFSGRSRITDTLNSSPVALRAPKSVKLSIV